MRLIKILREWMVILIIVAFPTLYLGLYYSSNEIVEIEVVGKERIGIDNEFKYIVYGQNEVFENTDSYLFVKFNSSDLQRDLQEGGGYNIRVVGWRVPFLSYHRNIISIVPQN